MHGERISSSSGLLFASAAGNTVRVDERRTAYFSRRSFAGRTEFRSCKTSPGSTIAHSQSCNIYEMPSTHAAPTLKMLLPAMVGAHKQQSQLTSFRARGQRP